MRGGLPDPLFEDTKQLHRLAREADEDVRNTVVSYLLFSAPIGRLRSADPILGDLTVMAREATQRVIARVHEIEAGELVARAQAKAKAVRSTRVEGAVPEDQA